VILFDPIMLHFYVTTGTFVLSLKGQNSNIVLIHGFKEYCALLFIKGSLLKDAEGILIQQTDNVQAVFR